MTANYSSDTLTDRSFTDGALGSPHSSPDTDLCSSQWRDADTKSAPAVNVPDFTVQLEGSTIFFTIFTGQLEGPLVY